MAQTLFAAVVAGLLSVGAAQAQTPAEKAQRSVEAEVKQADALGHTDPAKAQERFKALQARLDADTDLPEGRRAALKRLVQDRVRVTAAEADAPAAKAVARLTERERRDAEAESARRLFESVRKLQKEGKLAAAGQQARAAAERLPDSPAAGALRRTADAAGRLEEDRNLQRERARGTADALRGVDRAAVPPKGDVEYARDWKARTQTRKRADAVPMTARERAILQALDSPVTVNFKDSPLEAVLEYLRTVTGQPIVVDPGALRDAGVTYETRVTIRLKDVSLRFVLRNVLGELGLAYVVKGEAIQVWTAEQARNTLITRTHYVGDLLMAQDEFRATLQAAALIDLIETTIEPTSWRRFGGPGTIVYNHPTRSLVIKQTAEFHGTLVNGLP